MKNVDQFDILIVYSQELANSAASTTYTERTPFSLRSKEANYNHAYAYFLTTCAKNHVTAAFTTSADIIGAGYCRSYWIFQRKKWIKIKRVCYSEIIFDKFLPINKKQEAYRELLFASSIIKPFNDNYLFNLFFDKHETYKKLKEFSIPTVLINGKSKKSIKQACIDLAILIQKHPHRTDFSHFIVVKDRFGSGGNNIYKLTTNIQDNIYNLMKEHKKNSFILQPFAKFNKGYSYKGSRGFTDIRLIYKGDKIIQTYIRKAKKTDFRCNEHQGGTLTYITKKDIPQKIINTSLEIIQLLDKKNSLFALDFIISNNNNVYCLEGNTSPGIDWNLSLKKNERMSKKLIQVIVKELVRRVTINLHNALFNQDPVGKIPVFTGI